MRKAVIVLLACWLLLGMNAQTISAEENWSIEGAGNITSISIAEDGERVAIGSYGAKAYVYDSAGNQLFRVDANNVVTGVELLADGKLLVSSDDRHLYAYDAQGGMLWKTDLERQVKGMSASRDGSVLALIIQRMNELVFVDAGTGEVTHTTPIGATMRTVEVSAGGQRVVAASTDQYFHVLNGEGQLLYKAGASNKVDALAVTDEGLVAVGTASKAVELFDAGGKALPKIQVKDNVTSVSFSLDGEVLAVADFSGNFYVFDKNGTKLWETKVNSPGRSVELDGEGKTLYTGTEDGRIFKYDVSSVVEQAQSSAKLRSLLITALAILAAIAVGTGLFIMKKRNRLGVFRQIWRSKLVYLGLAPTFILVIVFLYVPAFSGLFHSLYDWQPGGRTVFIGLDNFKRMFRDPYVLTGIGNLGILIVTGVLKSIIPPLITAELIYHLRSTRLQYWFRTAFTTSMIIPGVALLLIWQNLYDPNVGLINNFLELVGLGDWAHGWLGDPKTALWSIIFIGFPFVGILQLLVLYAGLLSISNELIESAKMDGASLTRIIRSIHLPLLSGQFKLLIILALIGIVQDFNGILIVTGGGPMDSTYVPALQMYYAATKFNDLGYASALGVGMFLIILVITIINMKVIKTSND